MKLRRRKERKNDGSECCGVQSEGKQEIAETEVKRNSDILALVILKTC